jgi:DNA-binding transcriptional LysR family regulator
VDEFSWDDMKVAYQAAKLGSLNKAADYFGLNYTTVLRRIKQLEQQLDCKLFIHHQRGYQLTDLGRQLLTDIPDIEQKFNALRTRLNDNQEIKGLLKITILPEYSSFIHPLLLQCQQRYAKLLLKVDVSDDIVPLESGQAHLSIRAGNLNSVQADLIALKITDLNYSFYAAKSYIKQKGVPSNVEDFAQHYWVMPSGRKQNLSFIKGIAHLLPLSAIRYQSNLFGDIQSAIDHGLGIGPVDDYKAKGNNNLVKIPAIKCINENSLWLVYHKDLKNDVKIKAMVSLLKRADLFA